MNRSLAQAPVCLCLPSIIPIVNAPFTRKISIPIGTRKNLLPLLTCIRISVLQPSNQCPVPSSTRMWNNVLLGENHIACGNLLLEWNPNDQTPVDILCSNSAFGRFFIPRRVAAPPCFLAAHRRRGALKDFTRKNLRRSKNLRSSPIATPVNWAHETEHVSWKLTLTWTGNLGVKYQLRRTPD